MNKRISVGVAVSLVLIAVAVTFTATTIFSMRLFDSKVSSAQERATMYDKLSKIDKIVRQSYFGEIDDTLLFSSTADGFIGGLNDPYSAYLSAEEIAARTAEMEGTTVSFGVGVEKNVNGYMVINRVAAGSSAEKNDLRVGDIITKVDDSDVLSLGYEQALKLLSGAEGSKSNVTYNRDGEEDTVEVTRSTTEAQTVQFAKIEDVGYIKIDKICNTTPQQFAEALTELKSITEPSIVGLVIDVRDTPGGYDLSLVSQMLDPLVPRGEMITGEFRGGSKEVMFTSDDTSEQLPIVVLINGNTSGYSEVFAAVLRDMGNCRTVGRTSAGNGTYQQLTRLSDGSGVDLTTAIIIPPSGTPFNGIGLTPDYDVSVADDFILVARPDDLTDAQYKKAIEVLHSMNTAA